MDKPPLFGRKLLLLLLNFIGGKSACEIVEMRVDKHIFAIAIYSVVCMAERAGRRIGTTKSMRTSDLYLDRLKSYR